MAHSAVTHRGPLVLLLACVLLVGLVPAPATATDGEPAIAINPESLSMTRPVEGSPRTESILVSIAGVAELEWSVEPLDVSWLEAMTPSGTTAPGGSSWLVVELDPAGMEADTYTTTMV